MKNQTFGIEIEMTGLTRMAAARIVADYFDTAADYRGTVYGTYTVVDTTGRTWKLMNDGSVTASPGAQAVELVSPICTWDDIATVQALVRDLRAAGAKVNNTCGIHVHIGAESHTGKTLRTLTNIMRSKQDLLYEALDVNISRMNTYCKKTDEEFVGTMNRRKPANIDQAKDIWYKGIDGSNHHYHASRYHGLNLHSVFTKGTVEFRLFNGTLHAGKIKAYIQLCMAINHQALTQRSASANITATSNPKYTFRTWLLRLGLIGDEFKTARTHLLANLDGDIAWRSGQAR